MIPHLRNWLAPPHFQDREKQRVAHLLNLLLLALAGLLLIYALLELAGTGTAFYLILPGLLLFVGTRWLVFRGYTQLAAGVFSLTGWVLITVATYYYGGIESPAYSAYILIILITGLIMPTRMWLIFTVLTMLSSVVIFALETQGLTPASYTASPPLYSFIVRLSIVLMAALLLYLISRNFYHALHEVQRNEQAVTQALDYLRDTTVSREYLDKIIDSMIDMLVVLGPDGRVTRVNAAVCDLLGCDSSQLIGQPFDKVIPPDDFARIRVTGEYRSETTCTTLDGRTIPVSLSSSAITDHTGALQGYVCVAQDITEIKQTARALRSRVEQLTVLQRVDTELHHRLDVNYVLQMALDSAMRLSRAKAGIIRLLDEDEVYAVRMLGNYPETVAPDQMKQIGGIVKKVLVNKQPVLVADVTTDPDYVVVVPGMCSQMTVPMLSRDRVVGVLNLETNEPGAFTDEVFEFVKLLASRIALAVDNAHLYQTSQHQLTELQDLYGRVSGLEQLKTDMIRIAAHDLRNPLNIITGYVYLLEAELGDQGDRLAGPIRVAAERMQKITEDILSLQRIEQVVDQELYVPTDLALLVRKCFAEQQPQAAAKHQAIHLQLPDDSLIANVDAPQIEEAIGNLLSNAIKYTPDSGEITVSLSQDGPNALFQVRDTGYGIPDDLQANLFKPFFRAKMQETQHIEGTGLGLHLVKNIIERHHGAMQVHSVYGEGSTFSFHLPLIAAQDQPDREPNEQEEDRPRPHQPGAGRPEDARC